MAEQIRFRPAARPLDTVAVDKTFDRLPAPVAPVKPIAPSAPKLPQAPTPSNIDQLATALASLNPKITGVLNKYFEDENKDQAAQAELRAMKDGVDSWAAAVAKDPTLADRSPVFRQVYEARTAKNRIQARAGSLISEYWKSDIASSEDPTAINQWLSERLKDVLDTAQSPAERAAMADEVLSVSKQFMAAHRERARGNLIEKNRESLSASFGVMYDNYAAQGPAAPYKTDDPQILEKLKAGGDQFAKVKSAFLNGVAGGESSGKYNIRYDGGAGSLFDMNGAHPRVFVPTKGGKKSSAAGRYQFTWSTWVEVWGSDAESVPMTPENQDKAALMLAEAQYKASTGGKNLWEDLSKEGLSPRIQATLSGRWEAFNGNRGRHLATYNASLQRYGGTPTGDGAQNGNIPEIIEEHQKRELEARKQGMSPAEINTLSIKAGTEAAVRNMDESYLEVLNKPRPDGTPGAGMTVEGRAAVDAARKQIRSLRMQEENHRFTVEKRRKEVRQGEVKKLAMDALLNQWKAEDEARANGEEYKGPRGIPNAIIEQANKEDPELAEAIIGAQKTLDDFNKREDPRMVADFQRRIYDGSASPADVFDAVQRGIVKDPTTIRNLYEQSNRNAKRTIRAKDLFDPFYKNISKVIGKETLPGVLQQPLEAGAATQAFTKALLDFDQKNPNAADLERMEFAEKTFAGLMKTYRPDVDYEATKPENQAARQEKERAAREAAATDRSGKRQTGAVTAPSAAQKAEKDVPAYVPITPSPSADWRNTQLFPDKETLDREFARFNAADNVSNSFTSWMIALKLTPKDAGEFLARQRALAARGNKGKQ